MALIDAGGTGCPPSARAKNSPSPQRQRGAQPGAEDGESAQRGRGTLDSRCISSTYGSLMATTCPSDVQGWHYPPSARRRHQGRSPPQRFRGCSGTILLTLTLGFRMAFLKTIRPIRPVHAHTISTAVCQLLSHLRCLCPPPSYCDAPKPLQGEGPASVSGTGRQP